MRLYRVWIRKDGKTVHEINSAWPESDDPNPYLNEVIEEWQEQLPEPVPGVFEVSYASLYADCPLAPYRP
uniref:Cytochrome B561 n=1 Tax=Aureimonas frigidaquae TaxID=424757 RepID=A0A0N7KY82_9HYPH|nr:cytochrome B561 [Aureimonas frigidaquae]